MRTRSFVYALCGATAALALLGAGCGDSDDGSPSAESQKAAAVGEASQAYRDQVTAIVQLTDGVRSNFRGASHGGATVLAARQLAIASRAAASQVDELRPPPSLTGLNRDLAKRYRTWATGVDRELLRKPVSMERLANVVRQYGKAADHTYEQILVAP